MQLRSPKAQMLQLQLEEFKAKLDEIFLLAKLHLANHKDPSYKMPLELEWAATGFGAPIYIYIKMLTNYLEKVYGKIDLSHEASADDKLVTKADSMLISLLKSPELAPVIDLYITINHIKGFFSTLISTIEDKFELEFAESLAKKLEKSLQQTPQSQPTPTSSLLSFLR